MRYLIILFLAASLAAQTPPRLPRGVKLNPAAHWGGSTWACPEGWRLPDAKLPTQEEAIAKGVVVHCIPPKPMPPVASLLDPHGVWEVPESFLESLEAAFGKKTWKHYKIQYDPLRGRIPYCRVENLTHPLRRWDDDQKKYVDDFSHDPKNLVLTSTSFEFDAVAGDSIQWKVWAQ